MQTLDPGETLAWPSETAKRTSRPGGVWGTGAPLGATRGRSIQHKS